MENLLEQKKPEFLNLYCFQSKTYPEIATQLNIATTEVTELFKTTAVERIEINKAKQLFNARKGKEDFQFESIQQFYTWFKTQKEKQSNTCFYCGIEEEKLVEIFDFDNGNLKPSRGRGRSLELERIKTGENENVYSEKNCALVCHVCNNNKSDFMSAADFVKYFAEPTRQYLEAKYQQLQAKK